MPVVLRLVNRSSNIAYQASLSEDTCAAMKGVTLQEVL